MFPDPEIAHARASQDCFYLVELLEPSLRSNPALTSILEYPFMGAWPGPSHVIIVNTVGRNFISHAVVSAHGQGEVGEWDDSIALEALQQEFSDFGPAARGILAAGKGCYKWKIAVVGPLPEWSVGKVVLLGDAAHAMYPTRGQVRISRQF
jgi:salicylate hydroxylase